MRLVTIAMAAISLTGAFASEPLARYASPVTDISVKSSIESRNMEELKKISNEYAQSYRFASSQVYYKEPGKLKVVSKAGLIDVSYVINGNTKKVKAGLIHKTIDIARSPGQRQGANTVGLLTPSWIGFVNATHMGTEKLDGRKVVVYLARYKEEPNGTYFKLFMDPDKKYIVRQEQFHGDGKLKNSIRFLKPVEYKGVWVPTRTEVYNAAGRCGAVTRLEVVGINTGLSDGMFSL